MAYLGRGLDKISNIEVLDNITFTNSAGPYNITKDSTAFVPASANALVISIDGVIQSPSSYTLSVATITFDSSMASTSTMNFMYQIGAGVITTPSDGSVGTAQLATDAVTNIKVADDAIGVAELSATGTASASTYLRGDNSWAVVPAEEDKVKVSSDDTTPGYLNGKLVAGTDISLTEGSGGGNETLTVAYTGTSTDIAWQSVVTAATLTAVAGRGYPIDTSSNACTVTLPAAASAGDQIIFTDYARNWNTNALTIDPNSLNYQGHTTPQPVYNTDGESIHIVYMDATKGWVPLYDGSVRWETTQTYTSEWLIIAGGGGGGPAYGGGGGAGGYRIKFDSETSGGGTNTESLITFTRGTTYTVTVGAKGAHTASYTSAGSDGGVSSIIGGSVSLTTVGGGGGGRNDASAPPGNNGGSGGGGGSYNGAGGSGTANQGYDGGDGDPPSGNAGGGGGGSSAVGGNASGTTAGNGGAGLTSVITGASVARAGGGGGATWNGTAGTGAAGGGNGGSNASTALGDATANTGSGGGGGPHTATGGDGGSGIVVLRMPDADYSGTTTGSPTVTTDVGGSGETVIVFNASGSYTA